MKENLHDNSENHFRKTLRSDDFSTDSWDNPSGNVWEGIQATLPQAAQKRSWAWALFAVAFLLSGIASYWYFSTTESINNSKELNPAIAYSQAPSASTLRGGSTAPDITESENGIISTENTNHLKEPTALSEKNNSENSIQDTASKKNASPSPHQLQLNQSDYTPNIRVNKNQPSGNFRLNDQLQTRLTPTTITSTVYQNSSLNQRSLDRQIASNSIPDNKPKMVEPIQQTVTNAPPSIKQSQQTVKTDISIAKHSSGQSNQAINNTGKLATFGPLKSKSETAISETENQLNPRVVRPLVHRLLDPVSSISTTGNWYLGLRYGPSLKGFLLSGKDKEKFYKQPKTNYSGTSQILIGHRFNKRLQIEGGVGYSVANYRFQKNSKFLYDKSKERPENNHFESDYKINVETGNGNIDVNALLSRHQQDLITDGQEFFLVTDVKEQLSVLQIPLHLRYNLMTGKLMWYAKAGLTANLLAGYSGTASVDVYNSEGLTVKNSTLQEQPGLSQLKALPLDINLASGVEFQVTDRLSLLLEPGISTGLNAGYKTKNLKSIPISGNFNVGLNYFF